MPANTTTRTAIVMTTVAVSPWQVYGGGPSEPWLKVHTGALYSSST
jgi:hypothetical protein